MYLGMGTAPFAPATVGMDVTNVVATDGQRVFVTFVNAALARGADVVAYTWQPPGGGRPVERRAYVQMFSPWGWVLSCSDYVDDLATERWRLAIQLMGLGAAVSAVLGVVAGPM